MPTNNPPISLSENWHRKKPRPDEPKSLMLKTQELLKGKDPLTICTRTGLPYHWLCRFAAGRFKNPSVNRVQSLYEHLTGKPLC